MTKAKAIDFGSLDTGAACEAPFKLEFLHPTTSEALGCGVMLLGKDSAAAKEHVRRSVNKRLREQAARSKRNKDAEVPTIEQAEADGIDLLVVCTTGIWGDLAVDGQPLTYSPENMRSFYARFGWAKEQVDEAWSNLENFIKA